MVTASAADESMELCGVGRYTRREMADLSPERLREVEARGNEMNRRSAVALSQLSARLAVGTDSERVAARLVMGDVEGAALIAARSGDAAAYRLAFLGCGAAAVQGASSCQDLTVERWARLDPEDATPWVHRAGEALALGDESRRARCGRVARWQFEHANSLVDGLTAAGIAERAGLPADQRPHTRQQLADGRRRALAQEAAEAGVKDNGLDCRSLAFLARQPARLAQKPELQAALEQMPKP